MTEERRKRTEALVGAEAVSRLSATSVLIFGLGGVGGYALEALARAGVGRLCFADFDVVSESNCNRQILATTDSIGKKKAEIAAERVKSINPSAEIVMFDCFADESNIESVFSLASPDFVIDAVDTVSAKLSIIAESKRRRIPIITCMGTGNKLDATKFMIGNIAKSSICPLARVVRTELRKRNISGVTALWSTELPRALVAESEQGRHVPASISYVPAVAGLLLAGHVIRSVVGLEHFAP
jgi:tRNA A37 threonylcarbamoyladenosine dehydratase